MGSLKCDYIKRLIALISDNIKQLYFLDTSNIVCVTQSMFCFYIGRFYFVRGVSGVNFINILREHFPTIFLLQKISNPKHSFVIFGPKMSAQNASVKC